MSFFLLARYSTIFNQRQDHPWELLNYNCCRLRCDAHWREPKDVFCSGCWDAEQHGEETLAFGTEGPMDHREVHVGTTGRCSSLPKTWEQQKKVKHPPEHPRWGPAGRGIVFVFFRIILLFLSLTSGRAECREPDLGLLCLPLRVSGWTGFALQGGFVLG